MPGARDGRVRVVLERERVISRREIRGDDLVTTSLEPRRDEVEGPAPVACAVDEHEPGHDATVTAPRRHR